jgi:hypothetical protein
VKRPMLLLPTALLSLVITSFTPSSVYAASCDAAQGHFFGKKMPESAVISQVSNWWARTNTRLPPLASDVGISYKRVVM